MIYSVATVTFILESWKKCLKQVLDFMQNSAASKKLNI